MENPDSNNININGNTINSNTSLKKIKVTNLYIYPIKSCHEIEKNSSIVTPQGLLNDRKLVIITKKDHKFVTIRTHPKMYFISIDIDDNNQNIFNISIPDYEKKFSIDTSINKTESDDSNKPEVFKIKVWDLPCLVSPIKTEEDELNSALSTYLNEEVMLVKPVTERMVSDYPQKFSYKFVNTKPTDGTYFADLAPILITTQETFDYVNNLVMQTGEEALQMLNFRPNIVLQGGDKEFWENQVNKLKIGNVYYRRIKGCDRCKMTTFDLNKKQFRKSQEPLNTLNDVSYDEVIEGVIFGQNFCVDLSENENENVIGVGDEVVIIE